MNCQCLGQFGDMCIYYQEWQLLAYVSSVYLLHYLFQQFIHYLITTYLTCYFKLVIHLCISIFCHLFLAKSTVYSQLYFSLRLANSSFLALLLASQKCIHVSYLKYVSITFSNFSALLLLDNYFIRYLSLLSITFSCVLQTTINCFKLTISF